MYVIKSLSTLIGVGVRLDPLACSCCITLTRDATCILGVELD